MTTVYLAHPMDHSREDYTALAEFLRSGGLVVFDPARPWLLPGDPGPEESRSVLRVNSAVLLNCDAVLAVMSPSDLSLGVYGELQLAARHRKRCALLWRSDQPLGLALVSLGDRLPVFRSSDRAFEWLKEVRECPMPATR